MRIAGLMGALSTMLLLTACSGSSGGGSSNSARDAAACGEQIQLTFPSAYSATLASSITLRGTSNCSTITDIQVAGASATSDDNFANWQVVVPLSAGLNTLEASVFEGEKNQSVALAKIEKNELLYSPSDMQLSSDEQTLYVMDTSRRHILKVDMATKARSILSGAGIPDSDHLFGNMGGMALNETDNILYVASRHIIGVSDSGYTGIIAIDLTDGRRTLISNPDNAAVNGSALVRSSKDMVYDAAQKRLYFSIQGALYWVELDSATGGVGKISVLSDATTPNSANPFSTNADMGLALDEVNQRLIISDDGNGGAEQILSVDVAKGSGTFGERSIVLASGSELNNVESISFIDSDNVYLTDYRSDTSDIRIYKLGISSGELTQIVDTGLITNQRPLKSQHHSLYIPSTQSFLVSAEQIKGVVSVNLTDASYELLFSNTNADITGQTELFYGISKNSLDSKNQILYMVQDYENVQSLNLFSGERAEFAYDIKLETSNNTDIKSLGFDEELEAVITSYYQTDGVSYQTTGHVAALPANGDAQKMITSSAMDTGSDFRNPWDWVRLNETDGIVVDTTTRPSRYYQTNIETGVRTELNVDLSLVPANLEVEDMEISADKSSLYVIDDSTNAGLYKIDLASNVATIITDASQPADGNSVRLDDPEALALASDGKHVYVGDNNLDALLKVNLTTGSREVLIHDDHPSSNSWAERIQGIAVDTDKQVLYTSCNNAGVVLMMDEVTNEWVLIAE